MSAASLVALALLAGPTRFPSGSDPAGRDALVAAVNARLSAGVTPGTNALVPLWQVVGPTPGGAPVMPDAYFRVLGTAAPPERGGYFRSFDAYVRAKTADEDERRAAVEALAAATKRPWKPADYPLVADWLATSDMHLDAVRVAVARPGYFNPIVVTPERDGTPGSLVGAFFGPVPQAARVLGAALASRAMLRTAAGDHAGAWADVVAGFRLARHVGSGGTVIDALVGIAVHAIASNAAVAFVGEAKLTPTELAACRRDLAGLPGQPSLAAAADVTERALAIDELQRTRATGTTGLADLFGPGPPGGFERVPKPNPRAAAAWAKLDWAPAEAAVDRFFDRAAAALRVPDPAARAAALARVEEDLRALRPTPGRLTYLGLRAATGDVGRVVVRFVGDVKLSAEGPMLARVGQTYTRSVQAHQNVRVAFALAAYKRDRGRYPADLADLVPAYLPAVAPDVFTGRPPGYTRTAAGYELTTAPSPGDLNLNPGVHTRVQVPPAEEKEPE